MGLIPCLIVIASIVAVIYFYLDIKKGMSEFSETKKYIFFSICVFCAWHFSQRLTLMAGLLRAIIAGLACYALVCQVLRFRRQCTSGVVATTKQQLVRIGGLAVTIIILVTEVLLLI